jgi:2-dehydro-3-deoxygluconokinase
VPAQIITATLAKADYFLLSMEDAEALCGLSDPQAIIDWCHRAGAGIVALKLGAAGSSAAIRFGASGVAGYKVDCVDATGAGDCFCRCAACAHGCGGGVLAGVALCETLRRR